ncbi:hypothetical protein R4Z10_08740 [Niallia sp. XMNu-256]|uniref:hypothetical protein n=1 Tax=Niallia sp. XMNu-256 TaxID=3082444 RepID=UPI0030CF7F69
MKKVKIWSYTALIFVIIGFSVWSTYFNKPVHHSSTPPSVISDKTSKAITNPKTASNPSTKSATSSPKSENAEKTTDQKFTWTDYVIKPIVSDPLNQVFFKVLFYLLALVSLFLVIPAGLASLKRFKLFNFEFELEKQEVKETIAELINESEAKANYIKELTKDDTYRTIANQYVDTSGNVDFLGAISWFLSDMKLNYKENFDQNINWILAEVDSSNQLTIIK